MSDDYREPFDGRYYGLICVESDDPAPRLLFRSEEEARADLTRRQALPPDDDGHLSLDYSILSCDIIGAVWNCFDPDPRADDPLNLIEIARVHLLPGETVTIERTKEEP